MVYPPLREAPRDRGLSTAADQLALLNSTLDITKTTTGDTGLRPRPAVLELSWEDGTTATLTVPPGQTSGAFPRQYFTGPTTCTLTEKHPAAGPAAGPADPSAQAARAARAAASPDAAAHGYGLVGGGGGGLDAGARCRAAVRRAPALAGFVAEVEP